jgi:hypothetical protein
MPGRLRTASKPLRTLMESAPYSAEAPAAFSELSLMKDRFLYAERKRAKSNRIARAEIPQI